MTIRNVNELLVWQRAMDLVVEVYRITKCFPGSEQFGLTSQICRAAVSVPSNIAEGNGRTSTKDYLRHLSIARGSLMEVQTQIEIAFRLDFIDAGTNRTISEQSIVVAKLLNGLIRSLNQRSES